MRGPRTMRSLAAGCRGPQRLRRGRLTHNRSGFSLVELMVSLAIGSMLIAGAVYVYSQSRSTYRLNETVARLQDQGRYALAVIEPDIELAGYYGFSNTPDAIRYVKDGNASAVQATANGMRQLAVRGGDPAPDDVMQAVTGLDNCGINYAADVLLPVEGVEGVADGGSYSFGPGRNPSDCAPAHPAVTQADTLTIRHADTQSVPPQAGRLQLYTSQLTSRSSQLLFSDGVVPSPPPESVDPAHPDRPRKNDVRNLLVHLYYVAQDSDDRAGVPALRVKALTYQNSQSGFDDNELVSGVEDLQVQFGIDTGDYDADGSIDAGLNVGGIPQTDARATRYVNPDFLSTVQPDGYRGTRYQVVAVRVWVRVRAQDPEVGYTDTTHYQYADVDWTPTGAATKYRRVLMSRTVLLRNARIL